MRVLVTGNIPPNAGLSSSSALVCAAAISTAYAMQPNVNHLLDQQKRVCKSMYVLFGDVFIGNYCTYVC